MIDSVVKIDLFDRKILNALQANGTLSQRDLADQVGLSQNACWRRLNRLNAAGLIRGTRADVDTRALGFDLTVFVVIQTRHHSKEWSDSFRKHIQHLPEVVGFYRIGGEWDYLLKVVTRGMSGYDEFYQKLITGFDLDKVTGLFAMEEIIDGRPLDLIGANATRR